MNKLKIFAVVSILCLSFSGISRAEDAPNIIKDIKVNGFVSTSYNHNLNDPDTRKVNYRPFNENANSFNLDVAELVFQKEAAEAGDIGFRTDIMYGYTIPKAIRSTWPGVTQSADDDFDIQQAYVRYVAPIGNGLTLDMGKCITEMGAEVIEGYDAWNYNYSRSLLFYYTIPFTHTGLRGTYKFNDVATLTGEILNGWDNVIDNNKGKSYCAHLMLMPVSNTMINLKYMGGPEQTNNDTNNRSVFDVNLTATLFERLTLNFDYVNGSEQKDPNNVVTANGDSKWSGLAGVVRYAASDRYAINIRGETFKDEDGARTGTKQDMWEVTVTPEFTVKKNLVIRPEYRYDVSDKEVFDKGKTTDPKVKNQSTVAVNVFFYF
ncbi:MAG: porin [Nitrospinae bacterium]|nr:porin [Nitrospinota bacterium]